MVTPKRENGSNSGDTGKPVLTFLSGGKKVKRRRTYSNVARLQINRRFKQLEKINQLNLSPQKARQTIEETRKPISKLIRMKRNPKNRDQVLRATLTSEGKLLRVLFRGSSKRWEDMNDTRKERYRRMVMETLVKQTQAVSRRKGNEKKTIRQVRENILPELERSENRLAENIRVSEGKVSAERMIELQNMRSVVRGIISEMKAQTIPRERALVPFVNPTREREPVPFPGEETIRRMNKGISRELEHATQNKPAPKPTVTHSPESDEDAFERILEELAREKILKGYPLSAQAIEDYSNGKISRAKATRAIQHEIRGAALRRPVRNSPTVKLDRIARNGNEQRTNMNVRMAPVPKRKEVGVPHVPMTHDQKMSRIMRNLRSRAGHDDVRRSAWYEPRIQAERKLRATYRPMKKWVLAIRNKFRRTK